MKKVLSVLAIATMVIGLTGCIDDPDGTQQKISSSVSSMQ